MDLSPNFFGLGQQLTNVLNALDIQHLVPVWTLKQTKNKIFLDVSWTKAASKFPAENDHNKATSVTRPSSQGRRAPGHGSQDLPAPKPSHPTTGEVKNTGRHGKKWKSPATRKRDKQRFEKWKHNKHSQVQNTDDQHESQLNDLIQISIEKPKVTNHDVTASDIPASPCPDTADTAGEVICDNTPVLNGQEFSSESESSIIRPENPSESGKMQVSKSAISEISETRPEIASQCEMHQPSSTVSNDLEQFDLEECDTLSGDTHCSNCLVRAQQYSIFVGCRNSKCLTVAYCSRTCRSKHWTKHRPSCGKSSQ